MNLEHELWLACCQPVAGRQARAKQQLSAPEGAPVVTVILRAAGAGEARLRDTIRSLQGQAFDGWELFVLCDDASAGHAEAAMESISKRVRRRVLVVGSIPDGDIEGVNQAVREAEGEYVAFLDAGDVLAPDALGVVAAPHGVGRGEDLVYADEDWIAPIGIRHAPFFKPDWSADLLLATNYLGSFIIVRAALLRAVGGVRAGLPGASLYDAALRVTEKTAKIAHVPRILCSRRTPEDLPDRARMRKQAQDSSRAAIEEALERRGIDAEVEMTAFPGSFHVRQEIKGNPKVSIIIPTRDNLHLLRECVGSIESTTSYPNIEIIIIDNGSRDQAVVEYLRSLSARHKVLVYSGAFHYTRVNNWAARHAGGDYLLFLNDDTEVLSKRWIEELLGYAQRPDIGGVGPRLVFPDEVRIQHQGCVFPKGSRECFHAFQGLPVDTDRNGFLAQAARNCSVLSGACLMVPRRVFAEVKGFDEGYGLLYGDADLCFRMRQKGYALVSTPHALLVHHEGATRGAQRPPPDLRRLRRQWGGALKAGDPYYNLNLDPERWDFSPPRGDRPDARRRSVYGAPSVICELGDCGDINWQSVTGLGAFGFALSWIAFLRGAAGLGAFEETAFAVLCALLNGLAAYGMVRFLLARHASGHAEMDDGDNLPGLESVPTSQRRRQAGFLASRSISIDMNFHPEWVAALLTIVLWWAHGPTFVRLFFFLGAEASFLIWSYSEVSGRILNRSRSELRPIPLEE